MSRLRCSMVEQARLVVTVAVRVAHEGLQEREEARAGEVSRSHITWRRHDKVATCEDA